jgi:acyl-CoA reductase-like NAD-dependent aldehyde dehydrogenase
MGYFHEPTISTRPATNVRTTRTRSSDRVMSIVRFDAEVEAYAIAHDTEFGLASGVWTNDPAHTERRAPGTRARYGSTPTR